MVDRSEAPRAERVVPEVAADGWLRDDSLRDDSVVDARSAAPLPADHWHCAPVTPPDDWPVDAPPRADRSGDSAGRSWARSPHDHSAEGYSADSRPDDCWAAPGDSADWVLPPVGGWPPGGCSVDSAVPLVDGSHPAGCSANFHCRDDCQAGLPADCSADLVVPLVDGLHPGDYSVDSVDSAEPLDGSCPAGYSADSPLPPVDDLHPAGCSANFDCRAGSRADYSAD